MTGVQLDIEESDSALYPWVMKECSVMRTRQMLKCYCMSVVVVFSLSIVCACTPPPRTVISEGEPKSYELVIAKELDVLDAASAAIRSCFPEVIISSLTGKEKGFAYNIRPSEDRPTYKFLINKSYGVSPDGNDIVGYRYSIYADGQLLSDESAEINPLITEFKKALTDRGSTIIWVLPIKSDR